MSRYASGCDRVRRHVLSIKYYHAVAGCRGKPRSVAACRGQPERPGKWKVPLRGLERDANIVALLLVTIADRRVVLNLPRALVSARCACRRAGSQERETRKCRSLNDAESCGESSQKGGGRSANRRAAGLPKAVEAVDIASVIERHGGCLAPSFQKA